MQIEDEYHFSCVNKELQSLGIFMISQWPSPFLYLLSQLLFASILLISGEALGFLLKLVYR
jgi:hypothetical protein